MDGFAHGRRQRRCAAIIGMIAAGAIAGCGSSSGGGRKLSAPAPPRPVAYLGVTILTSTPTETQVMTVRPGSPAQRAGIRPGDELESVAGRSVFSPTGLRYVLSQLRPGQTVRVQVTGVEGGAVSRRVMLGRRPAGLANPSTSYAPAEAL